MAEPEYRVLPIRATAFSGLLARLGAAPNMRGFSLDTVVTPVSLVDSDITLQASTSTPLVNVPASLGEQIAPAANTRLATTGPLPAGPYTMVFWITGPEVNQFRIRRRNAADVLDVWSQLWWCVGGSIFTLGLRLQLALNELVVVENVSAGGAGVRYQASIFVAAG